MQEFESKIKIELPNLERSRDKFLWMRDNARNADNAAFFDYMSIHLKTVCNELDDYLKHGTF